MNMEKKLNITASAEPEEQKPGIFALATVKAEDASTVGVVDIVGPIGRAADENIKFADRVQALVDEGCKKIRVRVNSPGGCVFTALSIFDTLQAARDSGVYVQSEVMGLAASAASLVILAADKVIISGNSQIMVHEPSTMLWGKLGELRDGVDMVDRLWQRMVSIYTARTGQDAQAFIDAHTKDVFYTAEEALAAKLVDEIGTALSAEPLPEPPAAKEPVQAQAKPGFMDGMRRMAARLGLLPEPPAPTAEEKLTAALADNKKISAELEGLRAQLATAMEERATAMQEREAAQADRSADIEKAVAARLADMAQPGAALPPSQTPRKTEAPEPNALRADAEVAKWLAGGDFGSAVSYACQSAEHRAQVNRLRATLK